MAVFQRFLADAGFIAADESTRRINNYERFGRLITGTLTTVWIAALWILGAFVSFGLLMYLYIGILWLTGHTL